MSSTTQGSTSAEAETFSPIRWVDDHLELLEQTLLPAEETWLECPDPETIADAIYRLAVRGAPAIGVTAAYGLVVGLQTAGDKALAERFAEVAALLGATRPTAVNLRWALEQGKALFEANADCDATEVIATMLEWAHRLHREDIAANRRMGEFGAVLFESGDRVMTHCNTGALATAGYGTALGVIQSAWRQERLGMVWVDETRPLLQGARLTAWELQRLGIPFELVTDSSCGSLMTHGHVDRIVVGADRIAANGDAANKIGTYTLAVVAKRHGVPFYVAAPLSTIDRETATGAEIPIEQRAADEVTRVLGMSIAPASISATNYAFDVTPAELIAAIITDQGVLEAPYGDSIAAAFERASG
jgi:methylthioribose-1-phosphate isomerase